MSLLDRVRSWLGLEVRRIDRSIQIDTETAAEYLKQRTVMHIAKMHRDVEDFLDDMIAEQQRHEDKPLTFEPLPALPQGTLAAPVKQEPQGAGPTPPQAAATLEPPAAEQAAPAQSERRPAPKTKKKAAAAKQKAEAPPPPIPPEPAVPVQAAPSSAVMDDAALAALIQKERRAAEKRKKA
jgi:hypothetical protein